MTDSARWDEVKSLFSRAVDLPASARSPYLDRECQNPDVRREVESLLAANDESADFLDAPACDLGAVAGAAVLIEADDLEGQLLGPYRIVHRIGAGGMGTVYQAVRADATFEKVVAIKVVKRGLDTGEVLRRFRDERRTLARLDHPNIAKIFDGGTTADGRPYLVMDFVAGTRIDRYCDRLRLPVVARLRLFQTVCRAVQYAHQQLVVHRDLKPDNILVTDEGVPVLVDFGIAKVLTPSETEGPVVTRLADRRMTLAYASPEQVHGDPMATVSDVYSLGVILYELLSGRRPYRRKLATSAAYEKALDEGPPPPSLRVPEQDPDEAAATADATADGFAPAPRTETIASDRHTTPHELARQLSGDLDTIALKAMHREPSRRYRSAQELADDIERHLTGRPVLARPDTVGYRARKFVTRHRVGVIAVACVILAAVAGVAGVLWQARVARSERDRATASAKKAETITAFLSDTLSSAAPDDQGRDVTVVRAMDRAADRAGTELAGDPESLATIRLTIGRTYLQLGQIDKSITQLTDALAIRQKIFGPSHPDVAAALNDLGSAYDEQGDLPRAEALFRQALELARRIGGSESELTATTLGNLGSLMLERGALADAEAFDREALTLTRKLHGQDDGDVAQRMNNLAVAIGTAGRWDEAAPILRQVLAIVERVHGPRHPDVASALSSLASALEASGHFDEAEPYFQRAIALRVDVLGPEHPGTAFARYTYASVLIDHGQPSRALEQAMQVLALRGRVLPDSHPIVAASLQVKGRAAMAQGDLAAAESALGESLKLRTAALPRNHWLIASSKGILGECLVKRGQFAAAEPLELASYEGLRTFVGPGDARTRAAVQRLVDLYDAWRRPGDANRYRKLLEARNEASPKTGG